MILKELGILASKLSNMLSDEFKFGSKSPESGPKVVDRLAAVLSKASRFATSASEVWSALVSSIPTPPKLPVTSFWGELLSFEPSSEFGGVSAAAAYWQEV
jgi:hypothetical protein